MTHKKLLVFAILIFSCTVTGCTLCKKIVYHPNINQGNYFSTTDAAKIHIGMRKKEIIYILGTPIIKDLFGSNTWYYIYRREAGNRLIVQRILTLNFNTKDILVEIKIKSLQPRFSN